MSVSPMLQVHWEGVMDSSGEGLQVLGSSWAARHSDPIPAELRAPVPAPQGAQMGCFLRAWQTCSLLLYG